MKPIAGNEFCPRCGKKNAIKELLTSKYYEECKCNTRQPKIDDGMCECKISTTKDFECDWKVDPDKIYPINKNITWTHDGEVKTTTEYVHCNGRASYVWFDESQYIDESLLEEVRKDFIKNNYIVLYSTPYTKNNWFYDLGKTS